MSESQYKIDPNLIAELSPVKETTKEENRVIFGALDQYLVRYHTIRTSPSFTIQWVAGEVTMETQWAAMVVDEESDDMFLLEHPLDRKRIKISAYYLHNIGFVRD